jgi:excisionase family DNA binding protein
MDAAIEKATPAELVEIIANAEAVKAKAYHRLMHQKDEDGPNDRTLNARDVAQRMGCGKDKVYALTERGELPFSWRNGKLIRYSASGLEAWMREQQRQKPS